jgi:hypothetical protein
MEKYNWSLAQIIRSNLRAIQGAVYPRDDLPSLRFNLHVNIVANKNSLISEIELHLHPLEFRNSISAAIRSFVLSEVGHAFNSKKQIIPFRLPSEPPPESLEYFLSMTQRLVRRGCRVLSQKQYQDLAGINGFHDGCWIVHAGFDVSRVYPTRDSRTLQSAADTIADIFERMNN